MLICKYFGSDVPTAVDRINRVGLARFVLSLHPVVGHEIHTRAIFRVDNYPDAVHLCRALTLEVPSIQQWADGVVPDIYRN